MLRNVACVFVNRSLFSLLSKSTCEEEIVFHRAARLLFGSNSIAPQQMLVLCCVVFIVIFVVVFLGVFSLIYIVISFRSLFCLQF